MANEDALAWTTLSEVIATVRAFLDPILGDQTGGTWNPATWKWDP